SDVVPDAKTARFRITEDGQVGLKVVVLFPRDHRPGAVSARGMDRALEPAAFLDEKVIQEQVRAGAQADRFGGLGFHGLSRKPARGAREEGYPCQTRRKKHASGAPAAGACSKRIHGTCPSR